MSTRRDHPSYSRKRGAIKVYANVVSPEVEPRSFIVTNQTSSRELVAMVLAKYKITTLDPNLFYLTLEIGGRSNPGATSKQVIVLEDKVRPLEIQGQHPRRQSRFCLQMKNGGVIKVHDNSILPGLFNKSLFISTKTTSREVVQLLLHSYKPEEDPNDFYLCEVDSEEYDTHILQPHDCPLVIQEQWLQPDHHYFQLLPYEDRPVQMVRKSRSLTSLIDLQHSNHNIKSNALNSDYVKPQRQKRTRIKSAGSSRSQGSAPAPAPSHSVPSKQTITRIRSSLHQLQHELRLSLESLDKAVSETEDYDGGESSLSVDTGATRSRRRSYSGISDLEPEDFSQRVKQWSHQAAMHHNYSDSESYTTDSSMGGMNESRSRRYARQGDTQQRHSEQLILNLQKEIMTSLTDDQSDYSHTETQGSRQIEMAMSGREDDSSVQRLSDAAEISTSDKENRQDGVPAAVTPLITKHTGVVSPQTNKKQDVSNSDISRLSLSQFEKRKVEATNIANMSKELEHRSSVKMKTDDMLETPTVGLLDTKDVSVPINTCVKNKRISPRTQSDHQSADVKLNGVDVENVTNSQKIPNKNMQTHSSRLSPQNSVSDGNLSDTSIKSFSSREGKRRSSASPSVNSTNEAVAQIYKALVHDARKKKQVAMQNKMKQGANMSTVSPRDSKSDAIMESTNTNDKNNVISRQDEVKCDNLVSKNISTRNQDRKFVDDQSTDQNYRNSVHYSKDIVCNNVPNQNGNTGSSVVSPQDLGHVSYKSLQGHLNNNNVEQNWTDVSEDHSKSHKPLKKHHVDNDIHHTHSLTSSSSMNSTEGKNQPSTLQDASTVQSLCDVKLVDNPAPLDSQQGQIVKNQVTKLRKSSISSVESLDAANAEKVSVSGSRPESASSTSSDVFRNRYLAPTTRRRRMLPKIPDVNTGVMDKPRVLSASDLLRKLHNKSSVDVKRGGSETYAEKVNSASADQKTKTSHLIHQGPANVKYDDSLLSGSSGKKISEKSSSEPLELKKVHEEVTLPSGDMERKGDKDGIDIPSDESSQRSADRDIVSHLTDTNVVVPVDKGTFSESQCSIEYGASSAPFAQNLNNVNVDSRAVTISSLPNSKESVDKMNDSTDHNYLIHNENSATSFNEKSQDPTLVRISSNDVKVGTEIDVSTGNTVNDIKTGKNGIDQIYSNEALSVEDIQRSENTHTQSRKDCTFAETDVMNVNTSGDIVSNFVSHMSDVSYSTEVEVESKYPEQEETNPDTLETDICGSDISHQVSSHDINNVERDSLISNQSQELALENTSDTVDLVDECTTSVTNKDCQNRPQEEFTDDSNTCQLKSNQSHIAVSLSDTTHLNDSAENLPVYVAKEYQELPSIDMNDDSQIVIPVCAISDMSMSPQPVVEDIVENEVSENSAKGSSGEIDVLLSAPSGFQDANDTALLVAGEDMNNNQEQDKADTTPVDITVLEEIDDIDVEKESESVLNGTFTIDDEELDTNEAPNQTDSDANSAVTETVVSGVLSDADKISESNSEDGSLANYANLRINKAAPAAKATSRSRSMSDPNIRLSDGSDTTNKMVRVKSANQTASVRNAKSKPKLPPKPKTAAKPKSATTKSTDISASKTSNKSKVSDASKRPRSHSDVGISSSVNDSKDKSETSRTPKKEALKTSAAKKSSKKDDSGKTEAKPTSAKKKASSSNSLKSKTVFRDPQAKKTTADPSKSARKTKVEDSKSKSAKPQIAPKPGRKPKLSWTEQHLMKNQTNSESQSFPFTNFVLGHDPKPLVRTQESVDSTTSELENLLNTHHEHDQFAAGKSVEDTKTQTLSSISSEIANSVDSKLDTITEDHLKNWEAVQHEVHCIGFHAIDFENKSRASSFSDHSELVDIKSSVMLDNVDESSAAGASSFDKYLTATGIPSQSCTSPAEVDLVFTSNNNSIVINNAHSNVKTSTPTDPKPPPIKETAMRHVTKLNQPTLFQILRVCDLISITLINTTVDGSYPLRLKLFESEFLESGVVPAPPPTGSQRDGMFQSPSGRKPLLGGKGSAFTPVKPKKVSALMLVCVETVVLLQENRDGEKLLQEGDYIIEVNGVEVIGCSLEETQAELEKSGDTVSLVIARPKSQQHNNNTTLTTAAVTAVVTATQETQTDESSKQGVSDLQEREKEAMERQKEAEERYHALERDIEIWKEEYKHLKLQILEKDSLITDLSNALAARDGATEAALAEIPEEDEHTDEEEVAYI